MEIIFLLKNDQEVRATFSPGETVLQVAERNRVPLRANCEGFGVCGTCHIYVENMLDDLPEITEQENDTLDNASGLKMCSRLACQLVLNEKLNGLKIRIP